MNGDVMSLEVPLAPEQEEALEQAFHRNPFPDQFARHSISQSIGLPEAQLQVKPVVHVI